jgi:DNA-binding NarL/FixJ family response regulator
LAPSVGKAGTQGYVVKSRGAHDLIDALDRLIGGGTFFDNPSPSDAKRDNNQIEAFFFVSPESGDGAAESFVTEPASSNPLNRLPLLGS